MDPAQRSSGRWSLLRRSKREALQTMPAGYVTPGTSQRNALEKAAREAFLICISPR